MSDDRRSFALNIGDDNFKQRQKDVFDQLAVLEKNRINTMDVDESQYSEVNSTKTDKKFERAYARHFSGKESIFKKPQNQTAKDFLRKLPDFKKNPHKWTKYSLEDVRDEDMSEKGNTRAALTFLKEIENRKSLENKMEEDGDEKPKIIFRKKTVPEIKSSEVKEEKEEKPSFSSNSSKIVMPEYVIGQKTKKEKIKKEKVDAGKQLKLDHLYEEDE